MGRAPFFETPNLSFEERVGNVAPARRSTPPRLSPLWYLLVSAVAHISPLCDYLRTSDYSVFWTRSRSLETQKRDVGSHASPPTRRDSAQSSNSEGTGNKCAPCVPSLSRPPGCFRAGNKKLPNHTRLSRLSC